MYGISEMKIFPFSHVNLRILCCAMDKGELAINDWCTVWNILWFDEKKKVWVWY